jgi:hypothetical protein
MIRYAVELTDSKGASIKTTIDAWDRADLDLKALAMYPLHKMKVKSHVDVNASSRKDFLLRNYLVSTESGIVMRSFLV